MRKISKKSIKKVNICQKKAFIVVFYRKVVDLRRKGLSMRGVATELNVSTTIVQKSLKQSVI